MVAGSDTLLTDVPATAVPDAGGVAEVVMAYSYPTGVPPAPTGGAVQLIFAVIVDGFVVTVSAVGTTQFGVCEKLTLSKNILSSYSEWNLNATSTYGLLAISDE